MADEQSTAWTAKGSPETGLATLQGEVDFTNSQDVRQWLREFSSSFAGDMQLDLSNLSYIDSSGLAVLIEVRKYLKNFNRNIRIVAVSAQVNKLFTLTQIGELFGI
ncbi:MAG: STAS domain-containing protein [Desulfovibrio sp.]|jgi:anti-sigma B factor antagonist|nr:STAS domain-containing protein [Desulfovibrio sp.]